MQILVFGAGVLGSLFAARLHEAGHDVHLLARGARLAQLREHGVVLIDALTERRTVTPVPLVERLDPDDAYDCVLVPVRKNQIPGVLPVLAANRHTPSVLFLHNNAAGATELVAALGPERVLLGFPTAGGIREGYAMRVFAAGADVPLPLGEIDGRTTERLARIAVALGQAGLPVEIRGDMEAWLTTHVALILPLACAIYVAGCDPQRLAHMPGTLKLAVRAFRENLHVLRTLRRPIAPAPLRLLSLLPDALLVLRLQRTLSGELARVALAGHAAAARDEMACLAREFRVLVERAGVATQAAETLYQHITVLSAGEVLSAEVLSAGGLSAQHPALQH
jgi:2-dehydropantoate 2-reductase